MNTYVEIKGNRYPVVNPTPFLTTETKLAVSKSFKLQMDYAEAVSIFADDVAWNVVKDAETDAEPEITDCSAYCIVDSITDHRNGHVTITMRKLRDSEVLDIIMGGAKA